MASAEQTEQTVLSNAGRSDVLADGLGDARC
jgi:hypothetical protein